MNAIAEHPLDTATAEDVMEVDVVDPLMCSKQDLIELHNTVKDPTVKAFLIGILDTREYFSLMVPDLRLNF
jgi:hypothetical protein